MSETQPGQMEGIVSMATCNQLIQYDALQKLFDQLSIRGGVQGSGGDEI